MGRVGKWFVCAYPAIAFISAFEINTPTQIYGIMAVHSSNAWNASARKYTINLCAAALLVFSLRNLSHVMVFRQAAPPHPDVAISQPRREFR